MLKLRFEMNTAKHLNRKQKKCNNKNDKKSEKTDVLSHHSEHLLLVFITLMIRNKHIQLKTFFLNVMHSDIFVS